MTPLQKSVEESGLRFKHANRAKERRHGSVFSFLPVGKPFILYKFYKQEISKKVSPKKKAKKELNFRVQRESVTSQLLSTHLSLLYF